MLWQQSMLFTHHQLTLRGLLRQPAFGACLGAALQLHQRTFQLGHEVTLGLLTFCVLVLRNGFTVTGESACASPENFDAEIGRKIARENAINKVWALMGYELRSKLHAAANSQ